MRNIYLLARRDYLSYVTAWGFWLGLLITPFMLFIFTAAPTLIASNQPARYFTVIEADSTLKDAIQSEFNTSRVRMARAQVQALELLGQDPTDQLEQFDTAIDEGASPEEALSAAGLEQSGIVPQADYIYVPPPAETAEALNDWLLGNRQIEVNGEPVNLFAAIIVKDEGPIEYWSENITDRGLLSVVRSTERQLAQSRVFADRNIDPTLLDDVSDATRPVDPRRARPASQGGGSAITMADRAPYWASIVMAFALWMLIFSVVNYLLMGTIEERSNKIFDSLLTSVSLPEMLAGKLVAVFALSATLMAFWGFGGTLLSLFVGDALPGDTQATIGIILKAILEPSIIIPALISFVLGYLMFGSIFLALGSLCDTTQEAQTLMTPILVFLMSPLLLFIVAMNDPTSPLVQAVSWFPLVTPFLLILRMPTEPPAWEVIAQLTLMLAMTLAILWLAAKVYRAGAVHGAGVNDVAAWFKRLVSRKAKG